MEGGGRQEGEVDEMEGSMMGVGGQCGGTSAGCRQRSSRKLRGKGGEG